MKCKKCGTELSGIGKFCPQCGEEIKRYCTECGAELPLSAKFCSSCGTSVVRKNVEKKNESDVSNSKSQEAELFQNDLKEQQSIEDNYVEQRIAGTSVTIRTEEIFLQELKQLAEQETDSKAVLNYYGEKVFLEQIFPLLNNDEQILKIRHIVHHNYANTFVRGGAFNTKEFLVLTNNRVIKFVKSFWLKPKIRCCYLPQIVSIEVAKTGGYLHGMLIGEKLKINSTSGLIIMRTMGKGSAYKVKSEIMQIVKENYIKDLVTEQKIETQESVSEYTRRKKETGLANFIVWITAGVVVGIIALMWFGISYFMELKNVKNNENDFALKQGIEDETGTGMFILGTYSAEVHGKDLMNVTTTFDKNNIIDIQIIHNESENIGAPAVEEIRKQILESQSLHVDTVSGATESSHGVIDGVIECAIQAGADLNELIKK